MRKELREFSYDIRPTLALALGIVVDTFNTDTSADSQVVKAFKSTGVKIRYVKVFVYIIPFFVIVFTDSIWESGLDDSENTTTED